MQELNEVQLQEMLRVATDIGTSGWAGIATILIAFSLLYFRSKKAYKRDIVEKNETRRQEAQVDNRVENVSAERDHAKAENDIDELLKGQ